MKTAGRLISLLFCLVGTSIVILRAQGLCAPPTLNLSSSSSNIFSDQQEMDLGDIMAQRLSYLRTTDDPVIADYLARIGDHLARHLPPTEFRFRYFIVDAAATDAFSLPGGRIYVYRGMIAQLRSRDELAALLGHEMGHIVTHQGGLDVTFLLQRVLGVTKVTTRKDIQKRLDELETNWRRNPSAFREVARRRQPEQLLADQVGLYAMTAAGYSPKVYPELFNRTVNGGGQIGNWLSDLLHTNPDQTRLQAMSKAVQSMPQACIARASSSTGGGFAQWRTAVLDFTGWSRRAESLSGVLAKVKLEPLTLGDVDDVRFSPDGKHLLAQKGESLYVFTSKPFAFEFRIHALAVSRPIFTADSQSVAFDGEGDRIEVWNIANHSRTQVDNLQLASACAQTVLSPDVRTLACLLPNGRLDLVRLPSGALMLEKRRFSIVVRGKLGFFAGVGQMGFSRDGRYFVAHGKGDTTAVIDTATGNELPVGWELKRNLMYGFVFLSRDRLLTKPLVEIRATTVYLPAIPTMGAQTLESTASPAILYQLPSGEKIGSFQLSRGYLTAVTKGDYVLTGPLKGGAIGILDLKSGKVLRLLPRSAADVYDGTYARQIMGGDLGLFDLRTGQLRVRAAFPAPASGTSYLNATASPDLKWLAASQGAVWDLDSGRMVYHVRPFQPGGFDGDTALYADFPAFRNVASTMVRLDLTRKAIARESNVTNPEGVQYGLYLVVAKPRHPRGGLPAALNPCRWQHLDPDPMDCDATYEVYDVRSGRLLWSRRFPKEVPRFRVEPEQARVIISWPASDLAVRDEIKDHPQLKKAWDTAGKRLGMSLVEVLDSQDGSVRQALLVETGANTTVLTAGERLLISHPGYMDILSLATGQQEGEIPGWPSAVSTSGNLLSARGDAANELEIYNLSSRKRLGHFAFPADVDFNQFSCDAKRLLVLTTNQTAYLLDMTVVHPPHSTSQ